jgi:hypothetical protein
MDATTTQTTDAGDRPPENGKVLDRDVIEQGDEYERVRVTYQRVISDSSQIHNIEIGDTIVSGVGLADATVTDIGSDLSGTEGLHVTTDRHDHPIHFRLVMHGLDRDAGGIAWIRGERTKEYTELRGVDYGTGADQ